MTNEKELAGEEPNQADSIACDESSTIQMKSKKIDLEDAE